MAEYYKKDELRFVHLPWDLIDSIQTDTTEKQVSHEMTSSGKQSSSHKVTWQGLFEETCIDHFYM